MKKYKVHVATTVDVEVVEKLTKEAQEKQFTLASIMREILTAHALRPGPSVEPPNRERR